jgi:Fur family peroxide stress response transcriptional regulator
MTEATIAQLFKENNFRATPQRIAVYKYLCENPVHPDADCIYQNVLKNNPSFSKTTVYNSLQALEQQGLIVSINIDSNRIHYDATTAFHGHFECEKCKRIYDFNVQNVVCTGLDGFEIKRKDVYYSGICPECK